MPTEERSEWVVLAHILRPQGRKGELLSELHTDFPERFETHSRVYLAPVDFWGGKQSARETDVTSFWLPTGKNQGRIVLKFAGIDSISEAEMLVGQDVIIPQEERIALDKDANYISDLVGCSVVDGGVAVGVVADVQFPTSADGSRRLSESAPLLVVLSPDGDEYLIPFVKDFLIWIDAAEKTLEMALPAGLLDINRKTPSN